jgi:NADH-quinone oxidoreductase subunit H
MFQTVADTIKLIVKEGLDTKYVDKLLFNIAPFIVMVIAMVVMAPIAFAKGFQIWDINIGVLFVVAVSSISVIGILMAGWASNNKYSLMGAMRSGAQIVSYELSAGLAILTIVVLSGGLENFNYNRSAANRLVDFQRAHSRHYRIRYFYYSSNCRNQPCTF